MLRRCVFTVAVLLATFALYGFGPSTFSRADEPAAKPAPDAKPAADAKPEPKPEPKPAAQPDIKPEAKAEAKSAAKPETKPDAPATPSAKPAAADKPPVADKPAANAANEKPPIALFNGHDLSGWKGDGEHWRVEDGAIVGSTSKEKPLKKGNTFLIWEGAQPENFELRVRFRFAEPANNSGIQFRSHSVKNGKDINPWTVGGYQYDLWWDGSDTGKLHEERGRGHLAAQGEKVVVLPGGARMLAERFGQPADLAAAMRRDEWNDALIRCVGNHVTLELNGVKTVDFIDHQADKRATKGLIALQLHVGAPMKVLFKDLLLQELPPGGLLKPEETPVPADALDLNLAEIGPRLAKAIKGKSGWAVESLRLIPPKMEASEPTAALLARLKESELEAVSVDSPTKEDRARWDQEAKTAKAHWSGAFNKALNITYKNGGTIRLPLSQVEGAWRLAAITVRAGLRAADGRPNVALGGTASASSQETSRGNVAARALDADPETLWCAATGHENEWWQVDLGQEQTLTGCQFDWENPDSVFHFRVDGSYDGLAWKPLAEAAKAQGSASSKQDFTGQARYVRVTFFGCYPAGWAALREARIFGEKSALQPAPVSPPEPLAPGGRYKKHDTNRPRPLVIGPPAPSSQEQPGAPPSDALVLFDGSGLGAWCFGTRDKGADPSLPPKWKAENGYMEVVPGGGMIFSREKFADAQLHIEWATPSEVKGNGQGRGNSGIFIFGHPEIQVLDSYNNDTYPDGQASAVYGFYPPLVNAARKPGEWQTYDIFYTAPRLEQGHVVKPASYTVLLNGILVQHEVEVPGAAVECHLGLQDHSNPVRYRNIWIRRL